MERENNELFIKSLFLDELDSFYLEYSVRTKEYYIDSHKELYISLPWNVDKWFDGELEDVIFRPDIPVMKAFLNLGINGRFEHKKSIKIRLYVKPFIYEWFKITMITIDEKTENREKLYFLFTNIEETTVLLTNYKFVSNNDVLTHFPNQHYFYENVEKIIYSSCNKNYNVIFFSIEQFRTINSLFGLKEVDNLLKYIAVRMLEYLGDEIQSECCRLSSDNFVVCMPGTHKEIEDFTQHLQWSVSLYPYNYDITLAFGVYSINEDDIMTRTPVNELLERAMTVQHTIKGNYKKHIAFYDNDIKQLENREAFVTANMNEALETEQFVVYFQPKVNLETKEIVGSEALVRWKHPEKGMITPGVFIPVFEKNGFIIELDDYVIKHTCRIIREWLDKGMKVLPVSVNISRTNMYNSRLVDNILEYVNYYNIPKEYIQFELLESGFELTDYNMSNLMQRLKDKGFKILMDDFGSGYSSLNVLKTLPVDILKIDIEFLPADMEDTKGVFILAAVVKMAKGLGMEIIAEGVETEKQLEVLEKIECPLVQGFYFYRPMPQKDYEKLIGG